MGKNKPLKRYTFEQYVNATPDPLETAINLSARVLSFLIDSQTILSLFNHE